MDLTNGRQAEFSSRLFYEGQYFEDISNACASSTLTPSSLPVVIRGSMASGARGGGDDGLDRDDFDAIAYLNERFPTEQALNLVDPQTGARSFLRQTF